MHELIAIREAARRLGVSDTAVRKAIAAGRIKVAGHTETSNRPLLAWPDCEKDWHANSDSVKRTHVGSRGSARREKYAPRSEKPQDVSHPAGAHKDQIPDDGRDLVIHDGMTLNEAKTAQAIYAARQAKQDYEISTGKLVSADDAKVAWYKHITAAKTRILGIPAACKSRYADLPLAAVAIIDQVCREALEDLSNG